MNPIQRAWLRRSLLALLALTATAVDASNPKASLSETLILSILLFALPVFLWTGSQRELRSDTMLSERLVGLSALASLALFLLFPEPLGTNAGGLLRLLTWPLVFLSNRPWGLAGLVLNFNLLALANAALSPDCVPALWTAGLLSLALVSNEGRVLRRSVRSKGEAVPAPGARFVLPIQHGILLIAGAAWAWILDHSLPELAALSWLPGQGEPPPPRTFGAFELLLMTGLTLGGLGLLFKMRRAKSEPESELADAAQAADAPEPWPDSTRLLIVRAFLSWLRDLAARGLVRAESETGRDFVARVSEQGFSREASSRSLGIFESARYASDPPDSEALAAIQRELARLEEPRPAAGTLESNDVENNVSP